MHITKTLFQLHMLNAAEISRGLSWMVSEYGSVKMSWPIWSSILMEPGICKEVVAYLNQYPDIHLGSIKN
jgi:hypothetical protein